MGLSQWDLGVRKEVMVFFSTPFHSFPLSLPPELNVLEMTELFHKACSWWKTFLPCLCSSSANTLLSSIQRGSRLHAVAHVLPHHLFLFPQTSGGLGNVWCLSVSGGINTSTMNDFKIPTWNHWMRYWEELRTVSSWELVWANYRTPPPYPSWHFAS